MQILEKRKKNKHFQSWANKENNRSVPKEQKNKYSVKNLHNVYETPNFKL